MGKEQINPPHVGHEMLRNEFPARVALFGFLQRPLEPGQIPRHGLLQFRIVSVAMGKLIVKHLPLGRIKRANHDIRLASAQPRPYPRCSRGIERATHDTDIEPACSVIGSPRLSRCCALRLSASRRTVLVERSALQQISKRPVVTPRIIALRLTLTDLTLTTLIETTTAARSRALRTLLRRGSHCRPRQTGPRAWR